MKRPIWRIRNGRSKSRCKGPNLRVLKEINRASEPLVLRTESFGRYGNLLTFVLHDVRNLCLSLSVCVSLSLSLYVQTSFRFLSFATFLAVIVIFKIIMKK